MFGSDRLQLFALVAGLILVFWLASLAVLETRGDQVGRYPSYQDAGYDKGGRAQLPAVQGGVGSVKYKEPCREQEGSEESDLCAQWRAAEAAEQSAIASWGQVVLAALGVFGLGITLWFNFRALNVASDTRLEARRIGEAQARAYVSITEAWITFDTSAVPRVDAVFQNSGQSPTRGFVWKYKVNVISFESGETFDKNRVFAWHFEQCPAIPASSSVGLHKTAAGGYFNGHEISAVVDADKINAFFLDNKIYCSINIEVIWSDVFGKRWEEIYNFSVPAGRVTPGVKRKLEQFFWADVTEERGVQQQPGN